MEEILNNPAVWIAVISLIGTILVGAWNVRSAMYAASDEISKGAATLLAEYRLELTEANTNISDLKKAQKEDKIEIESLGRQLCEMEDLHDEEIKKLRTEIKQISSDYAILEKKHNDLVRAYKEKDCENGKLLARIEKLEKGDTGPLKEK